MDRKFNWRIGSFLTPEQILHEENGRKKIEQLYQMSKNGILGTSICVGAATFLALKRRGPVTKILVPTLTGGLTIGAFFNVLKVSVFFQMIIIKLI